MTKQKMTIEELKADIAKFTKDLSEKTGVPIDPEEVWEESKKHMAEPPDD